MRIVCVLCAQDLKGKILLKGKKIGGLEENLSGFVEESPGAELSDDDELVEIEEENHHNDSMRRKTKVITRIFTTSNDVSVPNTRTNVHGVSEPGGKDVMKDGWHESRLRTSARE